MSTTIDTTADALRASILRGELAPGSRLPPERELAARMGVHRATLRTALARLTAAGLVHARQGSGYEVRDFRTHGGPDLLRDLVSLATGARLEREAADLLLVRRHLARGVLERLAEGTSARARARIAAAVDALELAIDGGEALEVIASRDLEVIAAILEATESAVLQLCLNPVASILAGAPRLRDAIYVDARESVLAWRALLVWLEHPRRDAIEGVVAALEARDARTLARLGSPRRKRKT
ncbi:FadR/GntR family transcriptional regulator [Sandaracinus amylolyticus]|uniref:FadR/GntR family transcriptional regulator n=1 Tax=Sandaracinus amylolyticus TaxID=927083 RepID=UPI001F1B3791|nr:GntR family transcriptional regulator [Sandaracinus amylolyticus]UJR86968.1 Hypothetical protein I5071_90690 [Sandaracinus amylolyticus]